MNNFGELKTVGLALDDRAPTDFGLVVTSPYFGPTKSGSRSATATGVAGAGCGLVN